MISDKLLTIGLKSPIFSALQKSGATKIAILATNEYEGFSNNGGISTYYTALSKKLKEADWSVILLLCQSEQKYQGKSNVPALNHVFSTAEVEDVLNLQDVHLSILSSAKSDYYYSYQSLCCLFFTQAIATAFPSARVYVEFPDVNAFGYHTVQAKQANLLPANCLTSITIHGCFEWVFEANDSLIQDPWLLLTAYREQQSFEKADLAFFPSYFLKSTIESYGWETSHTKHMPYFVPLLSTDSLKMATIKFSYLDLVGMTSAFEREYLRDYAKNGYTGQGEIVDLGCWLGSLTIPLILGLKENPQIEQDRVCVHAYDIFKWESWMETCVAGTPIENKYQDGDSFLDTFLEQTHPWKNKLKVYPGDLGELGWNQNLSIEFLVIDAMKSWELTNSILQNFFPYLIPNVSLIQHQDFAHYYTSWIHLIMYRLKDYFSPVVYVPFSSMIFKYEKEIPQEILQNSYSFQDFSHDEINRAFEYSSQIVPPEARSNIVAAKIMLYIHLCDIEWAKEELELVKNTGISCQNTDLEIIENLLLSYSCK